MNPIITKVLTAVAVAGPDARAVGGGCRRPTMMTAPSKQGYRDRKETIKVLHDWVARHHARKRVADMPVPTVGRRHLTSWNNPTVAGLDPAITT